MRRFFRVGLIVILTRIAGDSMDYLIREMRPADYAGAYALWEKTEGMGLTPSDEFEPMKRFLESNKDFCFVCEAEGIIIGTILCGNDKRRAYIYHLAVDKNYPQGRNRNGAC